MLLYFVGVIRNGNFEYWYLPYNLALAAIPLLGAVWLLRTLRFHAWSHWRPILATLLWVAFLPNSFYIVTDFIHLAEYQRVDIVQDVVMLMMFSLVGMAFGFISLLTVHQAMVKRQSDSRVTQGLVGILLLACSFAIYLGRDLRWNSWDILVQPAGLFSDIFERILHPFSYPEMWSITLSFFAMLTSIYFVLWRLKILRRKT